ncbi:zinc ribbon domain-containing protein [Lachnospiraceae bacterium 62-35]
MPPEKIYKVTRQYNKEPVSVEDMRKLQEIAENYRQVKNYVYARFGGIGSLAKLYPGYTVQNEMTKSGLREELGLPSVYFYLAVFDALGDIKGQWAKTKEKILELIGRNEGLSPEEKHYLRFLIKINNAFEAVLNQKLVELPVEIQRTHDSLAAQIDMEKMHRYLCRQVRKYHVKQHTDRADGFSVSERAYRYGDHGIYIATKEKRKRIFIPLTDNNRYKCQVYIRLFPETGRIEIHVPVHVSVRCHMGYTNEVGAAMGIHTMLTTDKGCCYGEELGKRQMEYAEWIQRQTRIYNCNRDSNPGRKKYKAKKKRLTEGLHTYINHELNRFLQTEKPQVVYVVKLPKPQTSGNSKRINHGVALWQRGYIRKRLEQKCKEQSIELIEVLGKNISSECSQCGAEGSRKNGIFICKICGYEAGEKENTAGNVLKRGIEGKILND